MRCFSSYGPVDASAHFLVERIELVQKCVDQLVGDPNGGGHYFTIWGPRQAGKTWLMHRAVEEIRRRYGNRFQVGTMSMQGVKMRPEETEEGLLSRFPRLFGLAFDKEIDAPESYEAFLDLFRKGAGIFERPVMLLIDEFDRLPREVIDALVSAFRDLYLTREKYHLHSLALIGVRAVLGVDSEKGSPFNVQRSLSVPNLTFEEVQSLFDQYQEESGQAVAPEVIKTLYKNVRGQPGLTCWFGELLTEKYNPGGDQAGVGQAAVSLSAVGRSLPPIGMAEWRLVHARALHTERNNNILNLVAKARRPYAREVQTLFVRPDVPFSVGQPWCDYLELNGIITEKLVEDENGGISFVCQFASPFIQRRLYNAFSQQLEGLLADIPVLDGADTLEDVLVDDRLEVAPLLRRYKTYLDDLRARGRDPFRDQPVRADFGLPEAVGHFHIYAWLLQAVGRICTITPEFPTGNGKVDLCIRYKGKMMVLEVKSLGAVWELKSAQEQAAGYAKQLGLLEVTLAIFVPTTRPEAIEKLEGAEDVTGIRVDTVMIPWRP